MAISKGKFEYLRKKFGLHTSWAVWTEKGEKSKSNVGDLSIFYEEDKLQKTLNKLNPDIVLAGLNGSLGDPETENGKVNFANFHSDYASATDYKIRFAITGTPLEGAFMTDVVKEHYETDSKVLLKQLREDPIYAKLKVEEFFSEILQVSGRPTIFAFGADGYKLIQKFNRGRFSVHKLYHYAHFQNEEKFRAHTLEVIKKAGFEL